MDRILCNQLVEKVRKIQSNLEGLQLKNESDSSKFIRNFELIELMNLTTEEIVLKLTSDNSFSFDNLTDSNVHSALFKNVIRLIDKLFRDNTLQSQLNLRLKAMFINSDLFNKRIYEYLIQPKDNHTNEIIKCLINIYCSLIISSPNLTGHMEPFKYELEFLIKKRLKDNELNEYLDYKLSQIVQNDDYDENPPDDFTRLSIVPRLDDIINNEEPFIRKNIIKGSYKSVRHYLDVQFRLLREDFFQPLRSGITEFRSIIEESKRSNGSKSNQILSNEICRQLERIDGLYVYFDVTMKANMPSDDGVLYSMVLNFEKSNRAIRWENSKRLIHGSLVCLSSDYFQNECLTGIVCERDIGYEKIVLIKFDFDPNSKYSNNRGNNLPVAKKKYVMLESTAFFESYKHVLHALVSFQLNDEENFPFKEQIVYGNTQQIDSPAYLKNTYIDFGPLLYEDNRCSFKCLISNEKHWPTSKQLKLEESQYEAVKLALKNKLAIIQGPPGTGKTYIGVKLVQLLIHNHNLWYHKPNESKKPILMICYTNHALDQFLENCVEKCKLTSGVVRVGGRCKSENLEPFLLRNLKRNRTIRNNQNRGLKARLKKERRNLALLKQKIFKCQDQLSFCNDNGLLLNLKCLANFIQPLYKEQFQNFCYTPSRKQTGISSSDLILLEWLGFSAFNDYKDDFLNNTIEDEEYLEFLKSFNLTRSDFGLSEAETFEFMVDFGEIEKTNDFEFKSGDYEAKNSKENYEEFVDLEYTNKLNSDRMLDDEVNRYAGLMKKMNSKNNKSSYLHYKSYCDFAISEKEIFDLSVQFQLNSNQMNLKSSEKYRSIEKYLKNISKSNEPVEFTHQDIWSISLKQRFDLYMSWVNEYRKQIEKELNDLHKSFNKNALVYKEMKLQEDKAIMENSYIIAMTTTGSARYHSVLKEIGPRIVIVEEAAEVFEQHIVSSLSKHCEHLILIGDHIQLRPNPAVYKLAIDYHLDVSLFERLLNNNCKKVMLNCQHRMRPEISILMKNFYEKPIDDHYSVMNYHNVRGLNKDIFFLDHNYPERVANDSQSKSNLFEANFIVNLCLYLLKQNYEQSQITILTMYLGQYSELIKLLRLNQLIDVKCTTVDNYQGEENDIILLSLVRSNERNSIGFLKIYNRCCVALSRAKMGFYCIGDFNLLTRNSDKWSSICEMLNAQNSIGKALTLSCGLHPEKDVHITSPDQIIERLSFSGGCHLECNFRLKCGHFCELFCHSYDLNHIEYKCQQKCSKLISKCGHKCNQICSHSEKCAECRIPVQKIIKECGHKISAECNFTPSKEDCTEIVLKSIEECGHTIQFQCGKTPTRKDCCVRVEATSICKHESALDLLCKDQPWAYQTKCLQKCNKILSCNHKCSGQCKECYGGYVHVNCREKCKLNLVCGHKCKSLCCERCKPCQQKCRQRCFHGSCKNFCSEPCMKCLKPCKWQCSHKKCTKKCFEKCDRDVCNEPCQMNLNCGHKCIGLCGETCPRLCRICDKNTLQTMTKAQANSNIDLETSRFIHLIDCSHVIEYKYMDGLMIAHSKNSSLKLPECPICKSPIRLSLRYSSHIKVYYQQLEPIKQKQYCNDGAIKLEKLSFIKFLENERQYFCKEFSANLATELISKSDKLTRNELISYINRWKLFLHLNEMKRELGNFFHKAKGFRSSEWQNSLILYELNKLEKIIVEKKNGSFELLFEGKQKYKEVLAELERIKYLFIFMQFKNLNGSLMKSQRVEKLIISIETSLIKQITPNDKLADLKEQFMELQSLTHYTPDVSVIKNVKLIGS